MHTSSSNQKTALLSKSLLEVPVLYLNNLDATMVVTKSSQSINI